MARPICCICLEQIESNPVVAEAYFHEDCHDLFQRRIEPHKFSPLNRLMLSHLLGIEASKKHLFIFAWPGATAESEASALAKMAQVEALFVQAGVPFRRLTRRTALGDEVDCVAIQLEE